MLNRDSLEKGAAAPFSSCFVRPLYDSYCFAHIPRTVQYLLTGQGEPGLPIETFGGLPRRYNKLIVFFVDAFGWSFFERYANRYPFLQRALAQGCISQITSQFPSTTSAHMTCMNSGLPVGQSGVYEWFYYEPQVDDLISPLTFSFARSNGRETLKRQSLPPEAFYPASTLYQALEQHGISSYVFKSAAYAGSTYSRQLCRGATIVPFRDQDEALSLLASSVLADPEQPGYYFFYTDVIDHTCHLLGPDSPVVEEEIRLFFERLEATFERELYHKLDNTACLLIADHGQVAVNPTTTIYLNRELPALAGSLKTNRAGQLLVPAGSARDLFLAVKEEAIASVVADLRTLLGERGEVYQTKELLDLGFFGPSPAPVLLNRLGNVVVLPYEGESVWWYDEGIFEMRFMGHHGGLTPHEMQTPLILLPL